MTASEKAAAGWREAMLKMSDNIATCRHWYSLITADEAGREKYTFPFVDMLYGLTGVTSIQYAFSDAEQYALRVAIWTECVKDLESILTSSTADPEVQQRLSEYYHAIHLLGPPTKPGPELGNYTILCITLDRFREARDCAKILLSSNPNDDNVRVLLDFAEDHMSFPRFHTGLISRSQHAWRTASRSIQQYRRGKIDLDELSEQVRKIFDVWLGLPVEVDILSPKEGSIVFTSDDWQLDLYSIRASIFAGLPVQPDNLQGYWGALIGASSRYDKVHLEDGTTLEYSEIETAVEDNAAHKGARVKLYCAKLPYLSYPEMKSLYTHVVERILGVADFCINVRDVEYVRAMTRKPTGTLDTLVEQLEAQGYTSGHEIDEVAPIRMHRTYRRTAKGSSSRLRDDIRQGDTICWALQDDYENNRPDTADHYMNRGIAPVFLAWPRSIMDCDEAMYTQKLIDALSQGDVQYNVQILGKASGTQYCYLDLLVWSPLFLVEAMEKYLSQIPGGDTFRIQSFYYDAYPCPISMARTLEHSALVGSAPAAQKPSAASRSTKSPAVRPKEKKKNAAKAKRKHQKKHH